VVVEAATGGIHTGKHYADFPQVDIGMVCLACNRTFRMSVSTDIEGHGAQIDCVLHDEPWSAYAEMTGRPVPPPAEELDDYDDPKGEPIG
jgi:hypothetical protein